MASPLSMSQLIHADPGTLPGPRPPSTGSAAPHAQAGVGQLHSQYPLASPLGAAHLHSHITPPGPTSASRPAGAGPSPGSSPGSAAASGIVDLAATLSAPPKGHASNTSLYQCADCLKRYSRPEHLQRHIATHTLGKRFVCDVCGKAFGRADLLKRHRANHDDSQNGAKKRRINAAPGAGRVAHACQSCARARVKCEEAKPCTRCRNRNLPCEYGSSEAGSAAAMHLLHLSANAHRHGGGSDAHSRSSISVSVSPDPHRQMHAYHRPASEAGAATASSHPPPGLQQRPPPSAASVTNAHAPPFGGPHHHQASAPAHNGGLGGGAHESRLPTPDTMMMDQCQHPEHGYSQQQQQQQLQPYTAGTTAGMVDMRLPFSDFMRDVLYEELDPSRMAMAQGLAVLDFCDNSNLELNDMDFGMLNYWNGDGVLGIGGGDFVAASSTTPQEQYHQQQPQHVPPYLPGLTFGANNDEDGGNGNSSSSMLKAAAAAAAQDSADISTMRQRLVKVWTESPWRWDPGKLDTGWGEQSNLPVPSGEVSAAHLRGDGSQRPVDRLVSDRLEGSCRDKILAIVLSTCTNNAVMTRVASSFPSVDLMDSLIHIFLASHLCQVSEWIHFASFRFNSNPPELLACCASAGAVLTPNPTLRRFGYALQEAVRVTIPSRFEDSNTRTKDIGLVQALILGQDIGMWSGNRRKMEIAECHLNIPITMMRYRGRFQRSSYNMPPVTAEDEGEILEAKWVQWREQESWKRLVFHCHIRDSQMSLTTLTAPHMSYAELTLPLPESRQLWFARTAQEWQMHYLERGPPESKRPPSLGDLIRDIDLLARNHHRLDVQFALSIYLHGFWAMIWELRQLAAVHRTRVFGASCLGDESHMPSSAASATPSGSGTSAAGNGHTASLLLGSRHQELCKVLENFQLVTLDWPELSAQESLVLNLLRMHLHVSLDDLQLFSGKEGEDQARRIYPVLQRWADSADSRRALWHAGQILGLARRFPPGHLKDFYAIGVHHAALALWTYGIIKKAVGGPSSSSRASPPASSPGYGSGGDAAGGGGGELVFLDGPDSPHVARFISFGYGRAAIQAGGAQNQQRAPTGSTGKPASQHQRQAHHQDGAGSVALLSDPRACIEVAQEVLRANFVGNRDALPVVVENLCHLLTQLGNAAWAVGEA